MEDYLSARMISEPFCLFDCDIPIDFCCAVIISAADATSGLRKPPLTVNATSTAMRSRMSWDQFDDLSTMVLRDVGADLWKHTDLRPADVDVAQIYDGFSFIAMAWLEALGFCGRAKADRSLKADHASPSMANCRSIPTVGSSHSGRMHGWGYLPEACTQLWGEGADRQVPNNPEVAVVASGGGIFAGAMLLTRSCPVTTEGVSDETVTSEGVPTHYAPAKPGPMRVPPMLTDLNREYWTGGLSGELRILRCTACRRWNHPPTSICRKCLSRELVAEPVSGKGSVATYTINHHQWSPTATAEPYVIAIVELPEQTGLRQITNIINCPIKEVRIGMPVRVIFETLEDVAVPLFEPDK